MHKELILGIDIGTSSVKVLYLDPQSEFLLRDEEKINTKRDGDSVEQDATEYKSALRSILTRNQTETANVIAVGLSGQTPSLVTVDAQGEPVLPVLIWQDNRAAKEAQELDSYFGNPWPVIGTSLPWAPSACPAKMLWIARHQKEALKKTRWLLQPKDYLGIQLTGNAISDPWSSKGICNVLSEEPIDSVFEFTGWDRVVAPEIRAGYQSRGKVSIAGSAWSGLRAGVEVSVGWSDAMSGMLSLGVFEEPTSFVITGTSAIVGTSLKGNPNDAGTLYVIPDSCAPLSVIYGPTQMSGGAISWAAKVLGVNENELVQMGYENQETNLPIFLPYIAGERAPLWRSDIRGAYTRLSIEHSRTALARATMEGVACAERQVMELSQELAGSFLPRVTLGGHAGNDARWLKIRSRTMGRSLRRIEDSDTTCRGSAILAYANLTGDLNNAFKTLAIKGNDVSVSDEESDYANRVFAAFLEEQSKLLSTQRSHL